MHACLLVAMYYFAEKRGKDRERASLYYKLAKSVHVYAIKYFQIGQSHSLLFVDHLLLTTVYKFILSFRHLSLHQCAMFH